MPLVEAPRQGRDAIGRIRADTYLGMAFSNLVALAIMVTTAATLHVAGVTEIETSTQAAEALKPVAGAFAFVVFTLGIVGTGLLAVPVLAGSAAYAHGEARQWPTGLARNQWRRKPSIHHLVGDDDWRWNEFYINQSDKGAILERGHQWDRRRARDGGYDGYHGEPRNHG